MLRKVKISDSPALANLMVQLGYPTTEEEMRYRIENIMKDTHYETIVAEIDYKVVGMVGLYKGLFYEKNEVSIRIVAFVVDQNYRNMGLGKQLLEVAENWALENGAFEIGLNSGKRKEREMAHQFYKGLGFIDSSIGFVKHFK